MCVINIYKCKYPFSERYLFSSRGKRGDEETRIHIRISRSRSQIQRFSKISWNPRQSRKNFSHMAFHVDDESRAKYPRQILRSIEFDRWDKYVPRRTSDFQGYARILRRAMSRNFLRYWWKHQRRAIRLSLARSSNDVHPTHSVSWSAAGRSVGG